MRRWSPAWARLGAVCALAAVLPGAAQAATTSPDATFQANGRVSAIVTVGNTIYIGGRFTSLRPPGAAPGSREVSRPYLAALDASTGALLPWDPRPNAAVASLAASSDGSTLFVGGDFTAIAGSTRRHFAALRADTASAAAPQAGWGDLDVASAVTAIAPTADRVYVGGDFGSVAGQTRRSLAAFDTPRTTGASARLDPSWHPSVSASDDPKLKRAKIFSLVVDQSRIFVGGGYTSLNGWPGHDNLDALDLTTGQTSLWKFHPGYPIYQLVVTPQRVYMGGDGVGGTVQAVDTASQSSASPSSWETKTDGGVQAIALIGSTLYVGGHFDIVCGDLLVSGVPATCAHPLATRHKLFAMPASGGGITSWNPGADSNLGIFAMAVESGRLEIGGDFTHTGNAAQQGFAQYSQPGTAAGAPSIAAPADGAQLRVGDAGPLVVDFSHAAAARYAIAVDGASYHWQTSYSDGGSAGRESWPLDPLPASGGYRVTVSDSGGAELATSSFRVPADHATLRAVAVAGGAAASAPRQRRFRATWTHVSDPSAHYAVALYRGRRLVRRLCTYPGASLEGRTTSCSAAVAAGSYSVRLVNLRSRAKIGTGLRLNVSLRRAVILARVSQRTFYPHERDGYRDRLYVSFRSALAARDSLVVRGPAGGLVRRIALGRLRAGRHVAVWNGRNAAGRLVRPGRYYVYVSAEQRGRTLRSASRRVAVSLLRLRVTASRIDRTRLRPPGRVRFAFLLSRGARVRLVVRSADGELVRASRPRRVRGRRWSVLAWDGRDSHGRIVAPGRYRLRVFARAGDRRDRSRWRSVRVVRAG